MRTCVAAAPVSSEARATPVTLLVTSPVPDAASETLRTISCVAAPCCCTAAAMDEATVLISWMRDGCRLWRRPHCRSRPGCDRSAS